MKKTKWRYANAKEIAVKQEQGGARPYLKLPSGTNLFKLKEGSMLIDILPYEVTKGNPFAEEGMLYWERSFWVHRGLGASNESYLCLSKTYGKPCPVCEYRAKLQKKGDDSHEDEIKALSPSQRQLINVIDLRHPDKGVQIFDTSYHLFGKRLNAELQSADEDDAWEKFFFLEDGMSIKLGVSEESYGSRSYNAVGTIHFKQRHKQYDEDILEKVLNLDELLAPTPYDKLKSILLNTNDDDDDEDEDESKDEVSPRARARKPTEEDDEDEDEEDEEPKPKKSKKSKDPEDEEDEDDEEDDWDDEDEEPKPKKSKKSKDPEDEADEQDAADWEEDDRPKKSKKAKKSKDEDDFDDDDWDETPRVKTKDEIDEEDDRKAARKKRKKKK